ncbi:hypothetical protein ACFRAI_38290 [Streptomyces sp. NPDC056637]|uniref:hypothetical protein n=2 Tax=unclassified Streptomyces TaxID=2593676 RepID=UPI0036D00DB5
MSARSMIPAKCPANFGGGGVLASPPRAREGVEELEEALVRTFAETVPGFADPDFAAALTVAAYRSVYVSTARRLLAGEKAAGLVDDHRARVHKAFDALEAALG